MKKSDAIKKQMVTVLLCTTLWMGSIVPSALADTVSESTATQVVGSIGIMTGDENGNLNLDAAVTRAEFAKMLVAASAYKDKVAAVSNSSPFKDVPYSNWAAGYIKTAVKDGWLTGYLDGTYRPDQTITLEEAVTGVLKLLGYGTSDFSGSYPSGQISLAQSLGLCDNLTAGQGQTMTRRNMMYLFYNLLEADNKEGKVYATTLGYEVDADGNLDYMSFVSDNVKGPYVVTGSLAALGINSDGCTVYRNGNQSTTSTVKKYDVVYYSTGLNTIWLYDSIVTGTCQAISPSTAAPTSVTVAGGTYTLETTEAKTAFSMLGSLRTGDVVTLLLGREGTVVSAMKSTEYQAGATTSSATEQYGIVTGIGEGSYTDSTGSSYSSKTVTIAATDGNSYTYPVSSSNSYFQGDIIKVIYKDGESQLSKPTTKTTTGTVNEAGTKLGNLVLAADIQIIDVYESTAERIYPSRLAGCTLDSSDIKYYQTNSDGEITHMILADYTGDLHQYGILTDVEEASGDRSLNGSYTYDIAGQTKTLNTNATIYNVDEGAAGFKLKNGSINSIYNLTKVELDFVQGLTAKNGNKTYLLADDVAVYELNKSVYTYSSLSRLSKGNYTITGYYDKTSQNGGRIRVIIAVEK